MYDVTLTNLETGARLTMRVEEHRTAINLAWRLVTACETFEAYVPGVGGYHWEDDGEGNLVVMHTESSSL